VNPREAGRIKRQLLTASADELRRVKGRNVRVEGDRVLFGGGMFRLVSNWNILTQIDHGYIEVKSTGKEIIVTYYISFKFLVIAGTVLVLIFVGEASPPVTLAVIAWLWLIGMNLLIVMMRFPRFVERIVRGVEYADDH
jgi:hypothetical protein